MIIFSGWGSLVGAFGAGLLMMLVEGATGSVGAAGMLAGVALAVFGWWVNGQPGRELVDANSGEAVVMRTRHTLFWIPIQYWGALIAVVSIFSF